MIAMKVDLVSVHKGQEFQLQRSKLREIQMLACWKTAGWERPGG